MKKVIIALWLGILCATVFAQDDLQEKNKPWDIPNLQWNFGKDKKQFIRFNATAQIWNRWNESNPGTILENTPKPNTFDIGIRRLRLQVVAQPLPWMLLYVQFGVNNFNSLSPRKTGDFFHDALVEFTPVKKYLSLVTTIDKKSPHVLRHTFATHLMNNGAELNAVKELLGHSSLAATQVYTHNSIEKLKEVYKKAHPKA